MYFHFTHHSHLELFPFYFLFTFAVNLYLRNLRFQLSWLHNFNWLSYSKEVDAAFCKHCVLYAPETAGAQLLKNLVKIPFRNWKKSLDTFNQHQNSDYHKKSVIDSESALLIAEKKQDDVSLQIDHQRKEELKKLRKYLKPIVETVILCGRPLPLRGQQANKCPCVSEYITKKKKHIEELFLQFFIIHDVTGEGLEKAFLVQLPIYDLIQ